MNDQSEFIEEMANMKAKLESVSSTLKAECRSLKSDMEEIKTKVIDPLTSKCAKLITEVSFQVTAEAIHALERCHSIRIFNPF